MDDWQLLQEYVRSRSQAAFAVLVERHVHFVYSVCLREVGHTALAEDVTQVVFLLLARKAPSLREGTVLAGWLFQVARFATRDAIKRERRRMNREHKAAQLIEMAGTQDDPGWRELEPLLHEALATLGEEERNVVLLRFFEGKSLRETGAALGVSEDAARKRVSRALDKLRRFFLSHGFVLSGTVLAGLLAKNAVHAAPAGCATAILQTLSSGLSSGTAGGVALGSSASSGAVTPLAGATALVNAPLVSARILTTLDGTIKAMLMAKVKSVALTCVGLSVLGAAGNQAAHDILSPARSSPTKPVLLSPQSTPRLLSLAPQRATRSEPLLRPKAVPEGTKARTKPRPKTSGAVTRPWQPIEWSAPVLERTWPPYHRDSEDEKVGVVGAGNNLAQVASGDGASQAKPASEADAPKPTSTTTGEFDLAAGEIRLDGKITAIDFTQNILVLNATSYTLANGKTNPLPAGKSKTVVVSTGTLMHVRGDTNRKIAFNDLQTGFFVIVIGRDKGSGADLPARRVALWNTVENGTFRLKTEAPAPPAPLVTDEVPGIPPLEGNVLLNGNFEEFNKQKQPAGWEWNGRNFKLVEEEDGNHYISVTSANPGDWRHTTATVPCNPNWKKIRVSARMKAANIQTGKEVWEDAHVGVVFKDKRGEVLGYGIGMGLHEDSGWMWLHATSNVPPGTHSIAIETGVWGPAGDLLVDDISVVPDATVAALPSTAEGVLETFEKLDDRGQPPGWEFSEVRRIQVVSETAAGATTGDGAPNHFLRLTNDDPQNDVIAEALFQLHPAWKRKNLQVQGRVRIKDLKKRMERVRAGDGVSLQFLLENADDRWIAEVAPAFVLDRDSDWMTIMAHPGSLTNLGNATFVRVRFVVQGATGTIDFDDLSIAPEVAPGVPPRVPQVIEKAPVNFF